MISFSELKLFTQNSYTSCLFWVEETCSFQSGRKISLKISLFQKPTVAELPFNIYSLKFDLHNLDFKYALVQYVSMAFFKKKSV